LTTDANIDAMVRMLVANWNIERIVLFGSRARGEQDELSDYDLLLVVPDSAYYRGIAVDIRRSLASIPVAKDLVVAKRSTIDRQGSVSGTIYCEALQEGVTLYAAA